VSVLFSLVKHPLAPWPAKVVAGFGVCYVFSPIQLIPTIIPIVGQLDDLFVLYLTTRLVRKLTPAAVLEECELRAQVALCLEQTTWASIRGAAQKLHFAPSHAIKKISMRPDELCPVIELDVVAQVIEDSSASEPPVGSTAAFAGGVRRGRRVLRHRFDLESVEALREKGLWRSPEPMTSPSVEFGNERRDDHT
jgi:uncharacterized membrane protein YkvA (DUF1232 family)